MDAHLAKPYTRKQLATILARWLPAELVEQPPEGEGEEDGRPANPPEARDSVLDQSALDNIRAVDDDGSVLAEVIQMYLDEAPQHMAGMRSALEQGRYAELGRVAHALKSASFNVGAKSVGELCRRVERQCKAGETADVGDIVAAIAATLDRVQPILRSEMKVPA
jgi:HPt (histidine-containing phosphotransfer) domain-containing protein